MKYVLIVMIILIEGLLAGVGFGTKEIVSIGPYNVSFDLGSVEHTITGYHLEGLPLIFCDKHNCSYYHMDISLPATKGLVSLSIVDYNGSVDRNASCGPRCTGDEPVSESAKTYRKIDGLPGWIAKNNILYGYDFIIGTMIQADYRLEPRGTGITGDVQIWGSTAGEFKGVGKDTTYYKPGPKENLTLQTTMNLINTIHVTKTITHTTYTQIAHNTYTTV